MQPYARLIVTHYVGNPNVILHVQLTNSGGRDIRVVSLTLRLTRMTARPRRSPRRRSPGRKTLMRR